MFNSINEYECPKCKGFGKVDVFEKIGQCPKCKGSGLKISSGIDHLNDQITCNSCNGNGKILIKKTIEERLEEIEKFLNKYYNSKPKPGSAYNLTNRSEI